MVGWLSVSKGRTEAQLVAFPSGQAPRIVQGKILGVPRNVAMSWAVMGCTDARCRHGASTVGEGDVGFLLSREPNAGLNPRTLGS